MRGWPPVVRAAAVILAVAPGILLLRGSPAEAHSFHVACSSSHVLDDDPIVFPGRPGAAHRHEFFGARGTTAGSTAAQLEHGATSCAHRRDTAAYWIPSLELNGALVRGRATAYYQRAGKLSASAPPPRLRVVAGDPAATRAQPTSVTAWQCLGGRRPKRFATRPACRAGEHLASWVLFPDCWDGRRTDSPDHRAHLAYAKGGLCPTTHPIGIMRLALLVEWPIRPRAAAHVRLGGRRLAPTGMHADFWNTWHQPTLRQLRWDCIEVTSPCGAVTDRAPHGS